MSRANPNAYPRSWWLCMWASLAAALFLAICPPAEAGEGSLTIGAHLGSWHSEPGYNNTNPGLYLRTAVGWTVGGYRNSVRRNSTYAGWTGGVEITTSLRAELTLGAITGYPAAAVLPLAAPSLRIGAGNHTSAGPALRLTVLPKVHPKQGAHVAHLSAEWRL